MPHWAVQPDRGGGPVRQRCLSDPGGDYRIPYLSSAELVRAGDARVGSVRDGAECKAMSEISETRRGCGGVFTETRSLIPSNPAATPGTDRDKDSDYGREDWAAFGGSGRSQNAG